MVNEPVTLSRTGILSHLWLYGTRYRSPSPPAKPRTPRGSRRRTLLPFFHSPLVQKVSKVLVQTSNASQQQQAPAQQRLNKSDGVAKVYVTIAF